MIKNLRYIILLLIVNQCVNLSGQDSKFYDEFYSALNSLARSKFKGISQITNVTLPVFRTPFGNLPNERGSIEVPPPPPPPGIIYYNSYKFDYLVFSDQLDTLDAKFMYQWIDSTRTFIIDQTRTSLRIIPAEEVYAIFKNSKGNIQEADDIIEKTFGSRNFIRVSTPIFNSNYSRIIISVSSHNGKQSSLCDTYVMKKRNKDWKIVKGSKTVTRSKIKSP
jgi:hypothetical protein